MADNEEYKGITLKRVTAAQKQTFLNLRKALETKLGRQFSNQDEFGVYLIENFPLDGSAISSEALDSAENTIADLQQRITGLINSNNNLANDLLAANIKLNNSEALTSRLEAAANGPNDLTGDIKELSALNKLQGAYDALFASPEWAVIRGYVLNTARAVSASPDLILDNQQVWDYCLKALIKDITPAT